MLNSNSSKKRRVEKYSLMNSFQYVVAILLLLSFSMTAQAVTTIPITHISKIALGAITSCATTSIGTVKCWGYNSNGQLGDNTTTNRSVPVDTLDSSGAAALSGVANVTTALSHSCALLNSGGVKCWGNNVVNQLGNNTTTASKLPVDVLDSTGSAALTGGIAITSAGYSTCVLMNSSGVKCWGANFSGELGDNSTTKRALPVDVLDSSGTAPLTGVVAISTSYATAGLAHTCALMSSGGMKCWGDNTYGQLGNNTTTTSKLPVDVLDSTGLTPLTGVASISIYGGDSCALMSAGGIKCWGYNATGQLGDNTAINRSLPVDVLDSSGSSTLSGISSVAAGIGYNCALMNSGGVKCWGGNFNGVFGNNTSTSSNLPVDVLDSSGSSALSGISAMTAGNSFSCAVTSMGGAKCWGRNNVGQVGDNSIIERHLPVDVLVFPSVIGMTGNGVNITNNDSTPSTTDNTDFGSTLLSTPVSKTFSILNTGSGSLSLLSAPIVSLTGTGCSMFSVTTQPSNPIVLASGNTSFTIQYNPTTAATHSCQVGITNDDSTASPYSFTITGIGTAPSYTFSSLTAGTGTGNTTGTTADGSYTENTAITLAASSTNGSTFVGWTPAACVTGFTLTANTTCTATFDKTVQTISFNPAATATYGDAAISLSATSSSGLAVSFASTTASVCTISGTTLTFVGVGTCTVTADQAGNAGYSAAAQVSKNITVSKKNITAQADNKSKVLGTANPSFTFSYTGLVSGDTISTPPTASTTAITASPIGSYPITCTGGSDAKYTISGCANGTLSVTLPYPTMTLTPTPSTIVLGTAVTANFSVTGAPSPTGNVTVSDGVVSCTATVAAGSCNLTPTTAGIKTFTATYSGDTNYSSTTATATVNIAGVIFSASSINVTEGGATLSYTLKLGTAPAGNVTMTLTPNSQVSISPTTLTFTTANWNTAQTVTVTAVDDTVYQGNRTVTVTHAITTGDSANYLTTFTIPNLSVNITDNDSPPAPYVPPSYNLTVNMTGTGKGTLGGTSAGSYTSGTSITLTATPDANSTFVGWTPTSCASVFSLYGNTTCSAQFDAKVVTPPIVVIPPVVIPSYSLTVNTTDTGKGTLGGTSAGSYTSGTNVTLTATPDANSTFVGWMPASCTNFALTADTTCSAQFDAKVITPPVVTPPVVTTYKLLLKTTGTGKGTLDGTPAGSYPQGTNVSLSASPDASSTLVGWTPASCAAFTLNADATCSVEFALKPTTPSTATGYSIPPCVYGTEVTANSVCGGSGEKTTITRVGSQGQLSNTIIDIPLLNEGWVSSSVVTAKGRIIGGTLTGKIENHGIISDFDFKGGSIIGGILSGKITNTSTVGGYFQNVSFTAASSLKGGILQGVIKGNPNAPVLLENVTIKAGSKLSGVTLGAGVILEAGVVIEPNLSLPVLEKPLLVDALGNIKTTGSSFYGGISVNARPYVRQVVQQLSDPVTIRGRLIAAPEHIGQKVDLFVYSPYQLNNALVGYYMLDESSNILLWNQTVSTLAAFKKGVVLESIQDIDMFVGHFIALGSLNIVFGYRLPDGTLVMNSIPNTIDVNIQ